MDEFELFEQTEPMRISKPAFPSLGKLSDWSLLGTATSIVVAVLFPPFFLPLADGYVTNLGFALLFAPPKSGQLVGMVNLPLLAIELLAITAVGALLFWWAVRGGDFYSEELTRHWRAMTREEKRSIAEILRHLSHLDKAVDQELLIKYGFSKNQLAFAQSYQRLRDFYRETERS